MRPAPEVVTVHVWGVGARCIPWALWRIAAGRRPLRSVPGLRFSRALGTGHGQRFTPLDADPRHWALLSCWETAAHADAFETSSHVAGWDDHSFERWRIQLRPLSSNGRWAGHQPFGPPNPAAASTGLCAVLTRARLVPRQAATFWKAVPPVAEALPAAAGLRFARGIGEAPIGLQATLSVWENLEAAKTFAYHTCAHRQVIEATRQKGWYTEQLFARFAVIGASGAVDGRNPLAVGSDAGARLS